MASGSSKNSKNTRTASILSFLRQLKDEDDDQDDEFDFSVINDEDNQDDEDENRTRPTTPLPDDFPDYDSYTKLSDFGYKFNLRRGVMQELKSRRGFKFNFYGENNRRANQIRYEALGKAVTEEVYNLLEKEGLERVVVPIIQKDPKERTGFFFMSPKIEEASKLLILIHGSGAVRAGQWARRLIINEDLESGTQIPYIQRALKRHWGVIVLNGNQCFDKSGVSFDDPIRGLETPSSHGVYVWHHIIRGKCHAARSIAIVAHSAGGYVVERMARSFPVDFEKRVKAVAFTDSFCPPHRHINQVIQHTNCALLYFAEYLTSNTCENMGF